MLEGRPVHIVRNDAALANVFRNVYARATTATILAAPTTYRKRASPTLIFQSPCNSKFQRTHTHAHNNRAHARAHQGRFAMNRIPQQRQ